MHDADREWMGDAACRDADTDLFFPAAAESSPEAEAFCHRCPVRDQCLRYALADPNLVGIWAGTSARQRRRMRRSLSRTKEVVGW